jgi:UDP-N-acetylglucosamine 2-epimerase (non-hydrolysing)
MPKSYFLMTLHRQENVDSKENLSAILNGLELVTKKFGRSIIFPIHPRTVMRLRQFNLSLPKRVQTMKPVGYLSFLRMEAEAELILTDSGGLQEEACILKVPCVTLRTTTERPETIEVGANRITGYSPERIFECSKKMLTVPRRWANPFGDGCASSRILNIVLRN